MGSVTCHGGSDGEITVSNPTKGNGGTYNSKIGSGTYSTTFPKTYSSLSSGNHIITIKDGEGCEKSYTINVTQPTDDTATMSSYVTGIDGSVTVTSAGGTWNKTYRLYEDTTSPYTVGGGTLVSTITGVTSANHSQTFDKLPEGFYYVVVTDANGCVSSTVIQSTFLVKGGSVANFRIAACIDDVEYLIDSTQLCEFGNLSLNPTTIHVGDYVQFTPSTNCKDLTTYCVRILGVCNNNNIDIVTF